MTDITLNRDKFVSTQIDDERVLLHLDSGEFFALKASAQDIWDLLDQGRDRATLLAELAQNYAAPAESLSDDVDSFLNSLAQAGFIQLT